MGQAKRRAIVQSTNGQTGYLVKQRRVRVVRNAKLQNVEAERVVMLMLGDHEPELAIAFNAAESRKFAAAGIRKSTWRWWSTFRIFSLQTYSPGTIPRKAKPNGNPHESSA